MFAYIAKQVLFMKASLRLKPPVLLSVDRSIDRVSDSSDTNTTILALWTPLRLLLGLTKLSYS
jgi:hypothetical protein